MTTHSITVAPTAGVIEARADRRVSPSGSSAAQAASTLWFGGWLFTIGFLKLVWWKAALGLVVWPYFLGVAFR